MNGETTLDELYHYGVKGMKWGVRRDARVLANRRRNVTVRKIKEDYDVGKITKEKRNKAIATANANKKAYIKDVNDRLNNVKNENDVRKIKHEIASLAIKEVPNRQLKKGLTTANKLLGIGSIGYTMGIGAAMATSVANPVIGAAVLSSSAISSAVLAGETACVQWGIDRLT